MGIYFYCVGKLISLRSPLNVNDLGFSFKKVDLYEAVSSGLFNFILKTRRLGSKFYSNSCNLQGTCEAHIQLKINN